MYILILGSGAREHVLANGLASSLVGRGISVDKLAKHVFVYPGNGGTADYHNVSNAELGISENDYSPAELHEALYGFIRKQDISLVVVGPEDLLAEGVSDFLTARGIKVFGPTQAAAQLETSKVFAKAVMSDAKVPTADYREFSASEHQQAEEFLQANFISAESAENSQDSQSSKKHWVLKADGLCAGKGVIIPATQAEAIAALNDYFSEKRFGTAGEKIIIEEFMEGEEASVLAFVDGETVRCLPASQDHKRAYDNDEGPNTGGMGVYTPVPVFKDNFYQRVEQEILLPVVKELSSKGICYRGILYAGLMIEKERIRVVEFNVRFGDPECQCVLPIFLKNSSSDLIMVMEACIDGKLADLPAEDFAVRNTPACCVVMASGGYPGKYETGKVINGLDTGNFRDNKSLSNYLTEFKPGRSTAVYHAGTVYQDGVYATCGGRVLSVCSYGEKGDSIERAINECYDVVNNISFSGVFYRNDIGKKRNKVGKAEFLLFLAKIRLL